MSTSIETRDAANIKISKTEADAASSARFSSISQWNNVQRGFAKQNEIRIRRAWQHELCDSEEQSESLQDSQRPEGLEYESIRTGLGFAVKTEKSASRRHLIVFPFKIGVCLFAAKRSQAAMEFLMTYGWAILVVLAAIVALAYFGVMSPVRFIPESCTLPSTSGIACVDFNLFPSSAHLFVVNGGGRDIVVENISIGSCTTVFGTQVGDGQSMLFNVTGCSFGSTDQKVKNLLVVSYTDPVSGFSKSASGSIIARVG